MDRIKDDINIKMLSYTKKLQKPEIKGSAYSWLRRKIFSQVNHGSTKNVEKVN